MNLAPLGISNLAEFGPKYRVTCADYLSRNNCGDVVGYSFTRIPLGHGEVTEGIELIGTTGIVRIDFSFRKLSVTVIYSFE